MKTLVLFAVIGFIKCASYINVGCWRDTSSHAMPRMEGVENTLTGPYKRRCNAIKKCYKAAAKRGHRYFAVQNGGSCAAGGSYKKYGESTACKPGGKGGPWANQVYFINRKMNYTTVGCWKDASHRAIPTLEGVEAGVTGQYQHRSDAIKKCYEAAAKRGYRHFAVQNGGWCAAGNSFNIYGESFHCKPNGKGGPWANQVYHISQLKYRSVGCWKDTANRALLPLEGAEPTLVGPYQHRQNAIRKCYEAATSRGHRYFAVQNGGWCSAGVTFQKFGKSNQCKSNGRGGPWANNVYYISRLKYKNIGCWKDTRARAIPTLEGSTCTLTGSYQHRVNAIKKCYEEAVKKGHDYFAIQNGGWCAAGDTYDIYGTSTACKTDGKGGPWANEVYAIV